MAKYRLAIREYQYNNLCDTYGCNNRAKHSLGREGYPKRAAHNLCDACLEDIAMQVPLEILLKREDVQEYIKEVETRVGLLPDAEKMESFWPYKHEPIDVRAEAPAPEEIPLDDLPFSDDMEAELVEGYSYKELQGMAKELGIPSFGVKKDELQESVLKALKER